jgi:hypothetical protein
MSDIPLKEYIDSKCTAMDRLICESQKAQNTAVEKLQESLEKEIHNKWAANAEALTTAATEMNRRLESMNEFRAQLTAQASTFLPRERFDETTEAHRIEHERLGKALAACLPQDLYRSEHGELVKKVEGLTTWKSTREGAASKSNLIAIVAVVITVIGIVLQLTHSIK